jgi:hypothetical protein
MFKVTKIVSDASGESRFEDVEVPLIDSGPIGKLSEKIPATSIIFREVAPSYDWDFHTAPQRQYIILLDGQIQIETSSGDVRQFCGGDILLVEDTTGKGHRTKNIIPAMRKSVFITLGEA